MHASAKLTKHRTSGSRKRASFVLEIALGACFDAVEEKFPGLRELVIDSESGGIHRFVTITLNGAMLDRAPGILDTPVSTTDEIEVISAIDG